MVNISGTYKLESHENLEAHLQTVGTYLSNTMQKQVYSPEFRFIKISLILNVLINKIYVFYLI